MAENEVKINDIPVATSASFTDNDLFLIVDDGEARLLRRSIVEILVCLARQQVSKVLI